MGWVGTGAAALTGAAGLVGDPGIGSGRFAACIWLFALVVWANLIRPRIQVRDTASGPVITLVNAFRDVAVPAALVDDVVVRSYLVLEAGGHRYTAVSVGHSTRSLVRGDADRARGLVSEPGRTPVIENYPAYVAERLEQVVAGAKAGPDSSEAEVEKRWAVVPVSVAGVLLAGFAVLMLL